MNSYLKIDPNKINIFHELTKRRIYVGYLIYDEKKDVYQLHYDKHYANSKNAIPIGPELDLFQLVHTSKKGQLFSVFLDRIPERSNPAYEDYCRSQNIDIHESNPIVLLGSIGSRGPSSFVFEKTYKAGISINEIIKLRQALQITQHDLAEAFGISKVTLQKIESGESSDVKTIKLLQIYFTFPEVAIWQLHQTGTTIHSVVLSKLFAYFLSYQRKK
jgi:DNA-binding XRE family transcriptional regulator